MLTVSSMEMVRTGFRATPELLSPIGVGTGVGLAIEEPDPLPTVATTPNTMNRMSAPSATPIVVFISVSSGECMSDLHFLLGFDLLPRYFRIHFLVPAPRTEPINFGEFRFRFLKQPLMAIRPVKVVGQSH